jgi:hypothetical protein
LISQSRGLGDVYKRQKQLRLTTVDGDNSWLKKINLNTVHADLVNGKLAESAISRLGGFVKFGQKKNVRVETIAP